MPEIEFININNEADVTICWGLPTLNKKSIGLKKTPPPIPTTPEMNPIIPPVTIDGTIEFFFIN